MTGGNLPRKKGGKFSIAEGGAGKARLVQIKGPEGHRNAKLAGDSRDPCKNEGVYCFGKRF